MVAIVFEDAKSMRDFSRIARKEGKRIALVPTMVHFWFVWPQISMFWRVYPDL